MEHYIVGLNFVAGQ